MRNDPTGGAARSRMALAGRLGAGVLAAALLAADAAAGALWSATHPQQVSDPAYGMTAFTVPVPDGWHFVGTILRPRGCHAAPTPAAGLSYSSVAPDGVTARSPCPGCRGRGTTTARAASSRRARRSTSTRPLPSWSTSRCQTCTRTPPASRSCRCRRRCRARSRSSWRSCAPRMPPWHSATDSRRRRSCWMARRCASRTRTTGRASRSS